MLLRLPDDVETRIVLKVMNLQLQKSKRTNIESYSSTVLIDIINYALTCKKAHQKVRDILRPYALYLNVIFENERYDDAGTKWIRCHFSSLVTNLALYIKVEKATATWKMDQLLSMWRVHNDTASHVTNCVELCIQGDEEVMIDPDILRLTLINMRHSLRFLGLCLINFINEYAIPKCPVVEVLSLVEIRTDGIPERKAKLMQELADRFPNLYVLIHVNNEPCVRFDRFTRLKKLAFTVPTIPLDNITFPQVENVCAAVVSKAQWEFITSRIPNCNRSTLHKGQGDVYNTGDETETTGAMFVAWTVKRDFAQYCMDFMGDLLAPASFNHGIHVPRIKSLEINDAFV